jgi:hypothetical protein
MGSPDGYRDAWGPAEATRVQHRSDAPPRVPTAWDASDGVPPDAAADAVHPLPALPDADAERSADLERDAPEPAARSTVR